MGHVRHLDEADFVIVGTGAGGATAARVLAEAGHGVVMLEEGPNLRAADRPTGLLESMAQGFRDFGTQATSGTTPMPLLQGRLVGGSTAINSAIIWRMPEDVRLDWIARFGLGDLVAAEGLDRVFAQIERELDIAETAADLFGGNSLKMEEAARALGLPGKPIVRNARHCRGRGRCMQGCPTEARLSMDVSYVPQAISDGARLHDWCRVEWVTVEGGRATGVVGHLLDPETSRPRERFAVRARRGVIVAAGALHTPVILRRSGLRGLVGDRFQAHPGCAVVGRFPDPITMSYGATQGYEIPMRAEGFKIESLSLPPEMLATRVPGAGAEWQQRIVELDHYAQWVAPIRMKAHGRVRVGLTGRPVVRFEPTDADVATAKRAVALICRMMFAAGATEVYPGLGHAAEILKSPREVEELERASLVRADFHFVASHLFGTACAGASARHSVVGPDLQSHDVRRLYVMDASVFPTNMGVNPQHSIMAVVWRGAERLAEEASRAQAA